MMVVECRCLCRDDDYESIAVSKQNGKEVLFVMQSSLNVHLRLQMQFLYLSYSYLHWQFASSG